MHMVGWQFSPGIIFQGLSLQSALSVLAQTKIYGQNMGFQLCPPPTHTETLFENKLCQKDKSSLRIVQGLASRRDLFKPFPPTHPILAKTPTKVRFYGLEPRALPSAGETGDGALTPPARPPPAKHGAYAPA